MVKISNPEVHNFLQNFNARITAFEEFKRRFEPQLAFRFSAFNWINLDENGLSAQLAYFLNPSEGHGQGRRFLDAFIRYIMDRLDNSYLSALLEEGSSSIDVKTEEFTHNGRRIDITITYPDFKIGIENKIWAGDQHNQLHDYSEYLSQTHGDKFLLLYLTPYDKEINEWTIDKSNLKQLHLEKKFLHLNYSSDFAYRDDGTVDSLFGLWISLCNSDKVKWYLKDLNTYLIKNKLEEMEIDETKEFEPYFVENAETVLKVAGIVTTMKNGMINKLDKISQLVNIDDFNSFSELKELVFKVSGHNENTKSSRFTYKGGPLLKNTILVSGYKAYCQIGIINGFKFEWRYWCDKDGQRHTTIGNIENYCHLDYLTSAAEMANFHKSKMVEIIKHFAKNN